MKDFQCCPTNLQQFVAGGVANAARRDAQANKKAGIAAGLSRLVFRKLSIWRRPGRPS
jgi:hypothetical protein